MAITARRTAPLSVVGSSRQVVVGSFDLNGSGAVTAGSVTGLGVESVTKVTGTGQYDVVLGPAFTEAIGFCNVNDNTGQVAKAATFTASTKTIRLRGFAGNGTASNITSCTVEFIIWGKTTSLPNG